MGWAWLTSGPEAANMGVAAGGRSRAVGPPHPKRPPARSPSPTDLGQCSRAYSRHAVQQDHRPPSALRQRDHRCSHRAIQRDRRPQPSRSPTSEIVVRPLHLSCCPVQRTIDPALSATRCPTSATEIIVCLGIRPPSLPQLPCSCASRVRDSSSCGDPTPTVGSMGGGAKDWRMFLACWMFFAW